VFLFFAGRVGYWENIECETESRLKVTFEQLLSIPFERYQVVREAEAARFIAEINAGKSLGSARQFGGLEHRPWVQVGVGSDDLPGASG
jgi:hypothetical protein